MNRQVLRLMHASVQVRGSDLSEIVSPVLSGKSFLPDQIPQPTIDGYELLHFEFDNSLLPEVNLTDTLSSAILVDLVKNMYRHRKRIWPSMNNYRSFVESMGPRPTSRKIFLNIEKILEIWNFLALKHKELLIPNPRIRRSLDSMANLKYRSSVLPKSAKRKNHKALLLNKNMPQPAETGVPKPKLVRAHGEMARKVHNAMRNPVTVIYS